MASHLTRRLGEIAAVLAALCAISAPIASVAGPAEYEVTYTASNGDAADVILTLGNPAGGGYFNVAAASGIWDGDPISGLVPVSGYAGNDNLFSPEGTYFTFPGVSFAAGGIDLNLANDLPDIPYTEDRSDSDPAGYPQFALTSLDPSPISEPASFSLLGTAVICLALLRRLNTARPPSSRAASNDAASAAQPPPILGIR
jgi:hypothetical protein